MLLLAWAWPALASEAPASLPATEGYAPMVAKILAAEQGQGQGWEILSHLTDRIGPRLSGSPGAEAAVAWTVERLRRDGLDAHTEPVMVPRWVRGIEEAEVVAPSRQKLVVTALGGSDPTLEAGITADVVEVDSFDSLHLLGEAAVRGKIVLFNKAMAGAKGFAGYGAVAPLRTKGAIEAARMGAVASLVRSLGTYSLRLPHTGAMSYDAAVPHIPAAAVTAEDAELIHRLLASGAAVRVRLRLGCQTLPDVPSANVVADLRGRERPEEVVLIGGHLDSWDLATGAIDDGAGIAFVMEALRLLKALDLRPRRTIRGVLFMNEENGGRGSEGYAAAHAAELARHVAAIESDSGAGRPAGFTAKAGPGGAEMVTRIAALLKAIAPADTVTPGGEGGADIGRLGEAGVPLLSLRQDDAHYFDWHHTPADTLDKVDPRDVQANVVALAVMAYVLADLPEPLPRTPPPVPSR